MVAQGFSTVFILFVTLTVLRQIPHAVLYFSLKGKIKGESHRHYSTVMFYAVYLFILPVSGVSVWQGVPVGHWLSVGFIFMTVGILIRFLALKELGRFYSGNIVIQEDHTLIQSGIYALCRHPLHLSLLVELLGMNLISHRPLLFILWAGLLVVVLDRNKKEDMILRQEVGEAESYESRVPSMNILLGIVRKTQGSSTERQSRP